MKVNYPQTILNKSYGSTNTEVYLSRLCNETFLSLWSYPNLFRDQGRTNSKRSETKGDGKELCDVLVVFENHIIIFSDKKCAFSNSGDVRQDWSRWYKKAVRVSANQIYGAERWILNYPRTIFIDKKCSQPFPYEIPSKENAIVHRIIVAHEASKKCIKHLGGSGSLMVSPHIIGDMHINAQDHQCIPFAIGQVNPQKGYVHIFDDTSLEVVMKTLDTISDFIRYLVKKEELIQSGKLIGATGEDDLLGYYLENIDKNGEHTFFSKSKKTIDGIAIDGGIWDSFSKHPSRLAQIEANEISYSWDKLIEKFIFHVTTGTSYHLSHPNIRSQEEIFRLLAKENRTRRRLLATAINELISKTPDNKRATKTIFPSRPGEPFYLFLLLPKLKNIPYKKYRQVRYELLGCYLQILKLEYPEALDIIGLATETGTSEERSEDFIYLDASEWTIANNKEAEELKREFINQGLLGKRTMFRSSIQEYPDNKNLKIRVGMKGNERNIPCPCGSRKKFKKCCGREK